MGKLPLLTLIVLIVASALAGCSGVSVTETVPTEEVPVVAPAEGRVVAEGSVEPARWVELRAQSSGRIMEMLVSVGDQVDQGDPLMQSDPSRAELALEEAEAALASAEAKLAEVKGQPLAEELAVTEAELVAARAALDQAAAQRDRVAGGEAAVDVAAARASVAAARLDLKEAFNAHEMTMECFEVQIPDGSTQTVCPALGPLEERARRQWNIAQDRFSAAKLRLSAEENEAHARVQAAEASLRQASAQVDALEARLQLQQAGSAPQQIATAAADVERVRATVAAARAALEQTLLRAPFAGTVAEVTVSVGDTVASGQAVLVLATVNDLHVRTATVTELDAVRVATGQPVVVTLDAFPDAPLRGHVVRIGQQSEDYRGDVTYPVFVALDEQRPGLRWGMTALIEIDVEEAVSS